MTQAISPNQLLGQLQKLTELAKAGSAQSAGGSAAVAGSPTGNVEFGNLLTKAIDTVNQYQTQSAQAATQIEAGDGGASLVKAMIASQKANVAFQATVQVRNKVVSAYQDIMNMPI